MLLPILHYSFMLLLLILCNCMEKNNQYIIQKVSYIASTKKAKLVLRLHKGE